MNQVSINNHKKVSNHVYKGKPTTAEHSRELNSAKHQPATFDQGKDQQTNKQTLTGNFDRGNKQTNTNNCQQ